MRRGWFTHLVVTIALCAPLAAPLRAEERKPRRTGKPNVIVIVADDLGYGDLGCYGQNLIRTPNIDRLAAGGIRFTQHYAGSTVGGPSRCCLLTGRHTGHVSVRSNESGMLEAGDVTIAKMMKDNGYVTGAIGKWGIGHPLAADDPTRNGFDTFFGYIDTRHAHNHFPDFLWRNGAKVSLKGNIVKVVGRGSVALKKTQYSHDLFTQEAQSFIETNKDKPFFLYITFTVPHANTEAGEEGLEVPDDAPYSQFEWAQPKKNYAAMISRLDQSVGKISDLLRKLEISEQTLVIFTSDNGPHNEGGADPAFFDSTGALRGQKGSLYEGGIRVPLIVSWPGKIGEGKISHHTAAFWDLLPTLADITNVKKKPEGIDGISYLPTLLNRPGDQQTHSYLYWEFHDNGSVQAVRLNDWKLIHRVGMPLELYHLAADPSERNNVAARNPAVIKSITYLLLSARATSSRFPLRGQGKRDDDDDDDDDD